MIRLFLLIFLVSCGKYGNPVPPSALAPKAPSDIKAVVNPNGAEISWNLPNFDKRGKRLIGLESVRIYRRKMPSVIGELAGTESASEWELQKEEQISNYVAERENKDPLGAVAVKGSDKRSTGSFLDNNIEQGQSYQYYVVATNQGGELGTPSQILQVTFRGDGEVLTLPNKERL